MKKFLAMFLFMGLTLIPAQAQLDNYKYFVVPKRFDSFREINQYQTSTLVKFLLTKYSFETVYNDAIPEELFLNKCLGLNVQVDDISTYLQTVVVLVFNDCKGQEVFRTQEGKSKSKEFKEAFSEAIQEAMLTLAVIKHDYQGSANKIPETPTIERTSDPVRPESAPETVDLPVEPAVVAVITEEVPDLDALEEITSEVQTTESSEVPLWAQVSSGNGFILTHPEQEHTWVIMETSVPEVFMAVSKTIQGIAFKANKGWRLEYYLGDVLQKEDIQVTD